jgi:DNA-binding response OmpR family regulator
MRGESVLVVESDPYLERLVTRQLERMGFAVATAVHYDDVIGSVVRLRPRLVCLSLSLPRNSGYDVCDAIRADRRLAEVQILIMSDRATPQDMAWAEEAGASAFLRKPFTAAALAKFVRALVDPRRASRPSVPLLQRPGVPIRRYAASGDR